jgi:hypothetical protein
MSSHGYRILKINGKEIREHRLVMEGFLGRSLLPNENIHHKDGNRSNNSLENLELWVVQQPSGQRVEDKVVYAKNLMSRYSGFWVPAPTPTVALKGTNQAERKNQYLESKGSALLWGTLAKLGSSTVPELARTLSCKEDNIHHTLKRHPELFERSRVLGGSRKPGESGQPPFHWKVREGSARPLYLLKEVVLGRGYVGYKVGGKYRLKHRLVMEHHLGRELLPKENVHHKDGDRLNNDISNLELWSTSQPAGQRVPDLLQWAHEIIQLYGQPAGAENLSTTFSEAA